MPFVPFSPIFFSEMNMKNKKYKTTLWVRTENPMRMQKFPRTLEKSFY